MYDIVILKRHAQCRCRVAPRQLTPKTEERNQETFRKRKKQANREPRVAMSNAIAIKKRKKTGISNIDEYAKVLENALEAMDPPLDIHCGILRLIAEFAAPFRACAGAVSGEL